MTLMFLRHTPQTGLHFSMTWTASFLSPHFLWKDIGKSSECLAKCFRMLASECPEWRREHSDVIFTLILLEKKTCKLLWLVFSLEGYSRFFFFFLKKDGKAVKGIEIRIQTVKARGGKIKRLMWKKKYLTAALISDVSQTACTRRPARRRGARGGQVSPRQRLSGCQSSDLSGIHPKVSFCTCCSFQCGPLFRWCFSRTLKSSQNQRAVR